MMIGVGRVFGGLAIPFLVPELALAFIVGACTQYRVAPNDGGDSSGIGGARGFGGAGGGSARGTAWHRMTVETAAGSAVPAVWTDRWAEPPGEPRRRTGPSMPPKPVRPTCSVERARPVPPVVSALRS